MTNLSPAAQAVMDAAFPAYADKALYVVSGEQHAGLIAAAAIRAAAQQLCYARGPGMVVDVDVLEAIITELEGHA